MASNGVRSPYRDKWDADGDCQSLRSTKKNSPESLRRQEDEKNDDNSEKNRTWHSDSEDQLSDEDGRRSTPSFHSDEYDSPSEGPKSPYSQSRISSHSPQRRKQTKTTSSTPINKKGAHSICLKISVICLNVQVMAVWSYKPFKQSHRLTNSFGQIVESLEPKGSHLLSLCLTGYVGRPGAYRQEHPLRLLLAQHHRKGVRSQTKEYVPCKDLDMATKRLLSSRLLKIKELKNAFAELQQQYENIQMENRTLRQVTFLFAFKNILLPQGPPFLKCFPHAL